MTSNTEILIKVNGRTIFHTDSQYIADSVIYNGIDLWVENLKVDGIVTIILKPIYKPTLLKRIKNYFKVEHDEEKNQEKAGREKNKKRINGSADSAEG